MNLKKAETRAAAAVLLVAFAAGPAAPAAALFGEEDWFSGQNELLSQILAEELNQVIDLGAIVSSVTTMVQTINEMAALARTVKRVYDIISSYDLQQLYQDAKAGFAKVVPEVADLDREINELVENGQAVVEGEGAFFSRVTRHDAEISPELRKVFEHSYQATVWPIAFPELMRQYRTPSAVEEMLQKRYAWTQDERRRAMQTAATGVLAAKIKALTSDAEQKDNAELRLGATAAQLNLQTMRNTTELLNLEEQDAAIKEAASERDQQLRKSMKTGLEQAAPTLVTPGASF